ncbi:MAG: IS1634 family transposase [Verrucomicrobiae bacterium]|nr:IS1634 family transposase [Verrucomicrobiae bacterium]
MYFRVKRTGSYAYLQIVESFREKAQVHQRVLSTLGRLDLLQATGQFEKLMRSGLRFCQQLAVIDAQAAGQTQPVQVQRVGPDLVFGRLWESLQLGTILRRALESRRFEFDVERAVYLTVLHRLFASGSDRAAERWRQTYRLPGTQELDLHHLYRAMAFLGEPLDEQSGPRVLNTPRCTKDWIEEQLFDQRRDLFSTIDLVFFDTTSIYFEGEGGQEIGQYGKSKDHRPDLKQMVVGLALDLHGWPLCCELWPGNTADVTTLLPVVNRMRQRFGVRRVSIVADRGMISADTIAALESETMDCDYILGARMRSVKEISQRVLADRGRYREVTPKRKTSKDPSPLKVKEVVIDQRRYIVCLNEEQRRKDAADRKAIVEHLREQLKRGDKDLIGNKGYRKYLRAGSGEHFTMDEQKIEEESRYDGKWVLQTNLADEPPMIALAYKELWMVEDLFRTMKSILETRPIYHKRDATIRGHVFCSFLALLLRCALEQRLEEKGETWEWAEIIRGLDNLQEVEALFQGKRFVLRSQVLGQAHKAFRAAGVALPPTLREKK